MVTEIEQNSFNNQEIRYYDYSNIFFDTPLDDQTFENIKEILFSFNNITQVYFKDSVDDDTIIKAKYILEISPTMNDSLVEKYILGIDYSILKKVLNENFMNPDTWYVLFREFNNEYRALSLSVCKEILKYSTDFMNSIDEDYSIVEKIAFIYKYCKSLNYVEEDFDMYKFLKYKISDNSGYSIIFQYFLKEIGVDSFIGEAIVDGRKHNIVLARVIDEKYDINGLYLFDPYSDSLSSKSVENINYNYFMMNLSDYENTIFKDRLSDIFSCLVHDTSYDKEKSIMISPNTLNQFEKSLKGSFDQIHSAIENTIEVKDSTKLNIISKLYDKKMLDILEENYIKRKKEIFNLIDIDEFDIKL